MGMKLFMLISLFLITGQNRKSQTAEDSVKATIQQLFDAMKSSNSSLLLMSLAKHAILQAISKDADGLHAKNDSVRDFASSISRAP